MLVLHAWWGLDDVLVCWAERNPVGARASRRAGAPHPFAADADELAAVLPPASPGIGTHRVLLPTVAGRPVPSPEAAASDAPLTRSVPRPGVWTVLTVELT